MSNRIAILGSTGSIGTSALEVIEHLRLPYRAAALSAHRQLDLLVEQAARYRPAAVAITTGDVPPAIAARLRKLDVALHSGPSAMIDLVRRDDVDTVLVAVVGAAALPAVLAAVEAGKRVALANKESLVVAGSLLMPLARRKGVTLLPVDSEHSAVFQAWRCGRASEVRRIILTASGGPFRLASRQQLEDATLEDALKHPTWRMGAKITIDSATMFNKALEIIEAHWLFGLPPEKIEVVIHPESIVHSMVEFVDGSVIAQLSPPDMKTPIQYALTYPDRVCGIGRRLDLTQAHTLHFEPPDMERFPALRLAYLAIKLGGTAGAVLNGANEAAVQAFTSGKIRFTGISRLVETTITGHKLQPDPSMDDLLEADRWARNRVESLVLSGGMCPPAGRSSATQRI
ncbi:MAG: 1-deoxy-D-xylulose-5-phosphate reductoisomerase [Tepidisphaerales bacterium]